MGLSAEERRRYILDELRSAGRIEVADVAAKFGLSGVTIRRDLEELEKKGLLKKTYGGAVPAGAPEIAASVRYRRTRNLAAKRIVGKLAAAELIILSSAMHRTV